MEETTYMRLLSYFVMLCINVSHWFLPLSRNSKVMSNRVCSTDFDHYVFTRLWNSNQSKFTIHGLWPNYKTHGYPSYCSNETFNVSYIKDIVPIMNLRWSSDIGNNQDFWNHEWSKHGTCAKFAPYIYNQIDYFSTVVWLDMKLSGINSKVYTYLEHYGHQINTSQFDQWGVSPYCKIDKNGSQSLEEIRIRINRNFNHWGPLSQQETGSCDPSRVIFM